MKKGPGCPHADVQFCPLYIASHGDAPGHGCDDGRLDEGGCGADRRVNYAAEVAWLRLHKPGYVEQIEWRQAAAERQKQRARNMQLLRLH